MVLEHQLRKLARVGIVDHLAPEFGEDRLLAFSENTAAEAQPLVPRCPLRVFEILRHRDKMDQPRARQS